MVEERAAKENSTDASKPRGEKGEIQMSHPPSASKGMGDDCNQNRWKPGLKGRKKSPKQKRSLETKSERRMHRERSFMSKRMD